MEIIRGATVHFLHIFPSWANEQPKTKVITASSSSFKIWNSHQHKLFIWSINIKNMFGLKSNVKLDSTLLWSSVNHGFKFEHVDFLVVYILGFGAFHIYRCQLISPAFFRWNKMMLCKCSWHPEKEVNSHTQCNIQASLKMNCNFSDFPSSTIIRSIEFVLHLWPNICKTKDIAKVCCVPRWCTNNSQKVECGTPCTFWKHSRRRVTSSIVKGGRGNCWS